MASVPKSDPRSLLLSGGPSAGSIAEAPMPRSFPNSRKVYVTGSRPDLRVPMREIRLCDSRSRLGPIAHDAVTVYDTSGPYTDPAAHIDLRAGLPPLRARWIAERGDVEERPADAFGDPAEPAARSRLVFARPRAPLGGQRPAPTSPRCTTPSAGSSRPKWSSWPSARTSASTRPLRSKAPAGPERLGRSPRSWCARRWRAAAPSSRPISTTRSPNPWHRAEFLGQVQCQYRELGGHLGGRGGGREDDLGRLLGADTVMDLSTGRDIHDTREWILRNCRYIGRVATGSHLPALSRSRLWPGPATCLNPCRGTIGPLAGTNAAEATETPHRDLPTTKGAGSPCHAASGERPRPTGARPRKGEGKRAGERA